MGTVLFGMDYGINNQTGKISNDEIEKICHLAYKNEMDIVDTAPVYGSSQKILGEILNQFPGNWFKIFTKIPKIEKSHLNDLDSEVKKVLNNCLIDLARDEVHALFIHDAQDLLLSYSDQLFKILEGFKRERLISRIGVSVYNPKEARQILKRYPLDIISFPLSIFDQRFLEGDLIGILKEKNIEIVVRSIFVQGLLMLDLQYIEQFFEPILEQMMNYHDFIEGKKINFLEGIFSFIKGIDGVDYGIIGIDNLDQLKQNLDIFDSCGRIGKEEFKVFAIDSDYIAKIYNLLSMIKMDIGSGKNSD